MHLLTILSSTLGSFVQNVLVVDVLRVRTMCQCIVSRWLKKCVLKINFAFKGMLLYYLAIGVAQYN